ncbi:MAG: hypothetical protein ACJ8ER_01080 [Allosphingosinicella sp.]
MDNYDSRNAHSPEASTDELASSLNPPPRPAQRSADPPERRFEAPSHSDCLDDALAETIAETFPAGSRKPRRDGFTPEKIGEFLRTLAATGVVEHAAAAVGVSASAAYAFRNRRQGRAFARMWDAILINRARDRLASELQSRAIAGCVSIRKRDGVVVGEYHYHDNRLAMALLTRLDRLAEKEAASEAHLRALSEDMDEFIDCLADGGDADAFVEARRPAEAGPATPPPATPDRDPELTTFARLSGCDDYLDVDARDIDVLDLDPGDKANWEPDQWVRAYRSGFMTWLHVVDGNFGERVAGLGAALCFQVCSDAAAAAAERPPGDEASAPSIEALDLDRIADWTDDELAAAWTSGLIRDLADEVWERLAYNLAAAGEEE